MRVVHCITGLSGDGAQRMLLRLVSHLQKRSVDNFVISLSKRETLAYDFEQQGIPVHSLGMEHPSRIIGGLAQLGALMRAIAPDVLQGWMYHANLAVSSVAPFLRTKPPVVWNIRRGMDDYGERKFSTRAVVRANAILSPRARRIVYCTQESRDQHESFGFASSHGMVIGNGFDTTIFAPHAEQRRAVRERYGVADHEILIGNIGRDDNAKGRTFLFEAFGQLLQRVPHARLLLVGRGMEESNRELRGRLVAYRIAAHVILLGEYSPISELYPAMDILCSASIAEGFPNVIAEAMASGVPCVATDTGNTRTLVNGVGIVVPSRSGPRLAEGLTAMCDEGDDLRRNRGLLARERLKTTYSLTRVVDNYESLYAGVAERGRVLSPSHEQHIQPSF